MSPVAGQITFKECIIRANGSDHTIHQNDNVCQVYLQGTRVEASTDSTFQIDVTTADFPTGTFIQNSIIEATSGYYPIDQSKAPSGSFPKLYFIGGISQLQRELDTTSWGTLAGNYYIETNVPTLNVNLAP